MSRSPAGAHPGARAFLSAAFALALSTAAPAQTTSSIAVTQAWARATPPTAPNGALYLTIENRGAADDSLIALSTPVAAKAELHTSAIAGGVMTMTPLPDAPIKAGQRLEMKPGGTHVMLFGLSHALTSGETFPVTLDFVKAGAVAATATVAGMGR